MKREVLILDVTEMSGQHVCIAGIDLKSNEHIRLADPTPTRTTVRSLQLRPGDVLKVEYRFLRQRIKPHVEDAQWNRSNAKKIRTMPYVDVRSLLGTSSVHKVEDAFGQPWRVEISGNHSWEPARGSRSLASLVVSSVRLRHDPTLKPRIDLVENSGKHWHAIPFQDLQAKIHPDDCESCRAAHLNNLIADFGTTGPAIVRIGLTRPFASDAASPPACWLQVTNVFARERTHFV